MDIQKNERKKENEKKKEMMVLTCNPSAQEAEAAGWWTGSQPGLHNKFELSSKY